MVWLVLLTYLRISTRCQRKVRYREGWVVGTHLGVVGACDQLGFVIDHECPLLAVVSDTFEAKGQGIILHWQRQACNLRCRVRRGHNVLTKCEWVNWCSVASGCDKDFCDSNTS